MNSKTNNPNYSKVKSLIGVDRKTLALWWQKREEIKKKHLKEAGVILNRLNLGGNILKWKTY